MDPPFLRGAHFIPLLPCEEDLGGLPGGVRYGKGVLQGFRLGHRLSQGRGGDDGEEGGWCVVLVCVRAPQEDPATKDPLVVGDVRETFPPRRLKTL